MSDIKVKVIGASAPRRTHSALHRLRARLDGLKRAVFMRPRLMALGGLAAFVLVVGTPHVGWDYECNHPMRGPGSCRSVAWCGYYGIQGRRVVIPQRGASCQVVTFVPIAWRRVK